MGSFGRKLKRGQAKAEPEYWDDYGLRVFRVGKNTTVEQLERWVRTLAPPVIESGERFYISIDGFDDDPRGLWDIPEAREICQRVIDSGLFWLLGDEPEQEKHLVGARGCFALARGLIVADGQGLAAALVTNELMLEFTETLKRARHKMLRLLEQGASN